MAPKSKKKVPVIEVYSPEKYFGVQTALQKQGVTLVDLSSGKPFTGQISEAEIGLIHPSTPKLARRHFGFIPKAKVEYVEQPEVEAVLVWLSEDPGTGTIAILIEVISQTDLNKWVETIATVAPKFTNEVVFSITALTVPGEDPESAKKVALSKIQGYQVKPSAISNDSLGSDDELYEDEAGEGS